MEYPAYVAREIEYPSAVRLGDRGLPVKRVQEWLTLQDCATPIDHEYGPATQQSVATFQRKVGLNATGVVNGGTWQALVQPLVNALAELRSPGVSLAPTVLRVARQHLAQSPMEAGGDNRGPWVRVYCGGNEGSDWRWCAGFVTFVLKQACLNLGRTMPLKGSYSCDSLAYQAKDAELFVNGRDVASGTTDWKDLGAVQIFLVRRTATDWTHTGFSFLGADQTFSTIEGNTNDSGVSNGYEVCRRTRSVTGKDFVRLVG